MYKNKEQEREAARIRKQKQRNKYVTPTANVTPSEENVTPFVEPNVTPCEDAVPEDTVTHPDTIQCGAITYQWDDAPAWLQKSYMGSNHKWERMLGCIPDYVRPAILGKTGGGLGVGGRQVECGKGALPSDTQINIKGSTTEGRKEYTA